MEKERNQLVTNPVTSEYLYWVYISQLGDLHAKISHSSSFFSVQGTVQAQNRNIPTMAI
jgi:hypothetical protein